MDKELSQAIMKRSKLQNVYLNHRSEENRLAYKKQRNFCVTLLRKKKADYFNNLDLNLVRDNKMFWKTISPYFVNNPKKRSKITLADEKDNTLSEDEKIAETFNTFFGNIIKNFSFILSRMFNFYIDKTSFPNRLKQAEITPVHKKDDTNDKNNYIPVSILPSLSKAFKKCLCDQIYAYIDSILSKAQYGFRKGYSTQYSIIAMIEKWRRNLDQDGICGALFMDLSKAFDCFVHDFLLAKLEAYGFTYESLELINTYLTD